MIDYDKIISAISIIIITGFIISDIIYLIIR